LFALVTYIIHVVGARPNFIKVDPVIRAITKYTTYTQKLVHTGQHYDDQMSEIFFKQLDLQEPDINLEVGSSTHSIQTANIMIRFSKFLDNNSVDLVMVYGDVNSTIAAALVCSKRRIPIAHVESGLRSNDYNMPEEINRILTDRISDLLFTPSRYADENLINEGIPSSRIHFVGNVMIDTLIRLKNKAESKWKNLSKMYNIKSKEFGLITLHRPSNVDNLEIFKELLTELVRCSEKLPLIFPVHPRTAKYFTQFNIDLKTSQLIIIEPLGYLQFLSMQMNSMLVITDSGGIQEETTYINVPCITVRKNTERPITLTKGTNHLVSQPKSLYNQFKQILDGNNKKSTSLDLWDGDAGKRIAFETKKFLESLELESTKVG